MATLATHTRTTLWMVSRASSWRSTRLTTATSAEATAAQRQPPLMAKPSTAPAVQMEGRVAAPSMIRSWLSATRVSRMPPSAKDRSPMRKERVQRSAEVVRRQVKAIHTVSAVM